jgi:hypothetical protein
MTRWEYLVLALPRFEAPTVGPGNSAAVRTLDEVGEQGWEAVGMTQLSDDKSVLVLSSDQEPNNSLRSGGPPNGRASAANVRLDNRAYARGVHEWLSWVGSHWLVILVVLLLVLGVTAALLGSALSTGY